MKQKYFKSMSMVLLILACVVLNSYDVFACRARIPEKMEFFISPDRNITMTGDDKYKLEVGGCGSEERGKFLMLTLGPNILSPGYMLTNSFNGKLSEFQCRVKNFIPKISTTFNERSDYYKQQTDFFTSCLRARIKDTSPFGIRYPNEQPNCEITKLNNREVIAKGGYCFFSITPGSFYNIEYEIEESCLDSNYLSTNAIVPTDVSGVTGLYVAGDASGRSLDLKALDIAMIRLVGEPSQRDTNLTIDLGPQYPRWTSTMIQENEMGKIVLLDGEVQSITTSIFSSNICKKRCMRDKCFSPCNYDIPLGYQASLYEMNGNKKKYLDFWFQGGVIPAQWQGMFTLTHPLPYNYLKVGKKYRLEINLNDPTSNYNVSKDKFEQMLIKLDDFARISNISNATYTRASSTLGSMGLIGGMGTINERIKKLPVLMNLPEFGLNTNFDSILASLNKLINFSVWPPYYERVCNSKLSKCVEYNKNRSLLSLEFEITDRDEYGIFIYENVFTEKKGSLHNSGRKWVAELPDVDCK